MTVASMSDLRVWVEKAEPNDMFVYHVGSSAGGDVCREAMDLYEKGLVSLVRKRAETRIKGFYYIAQRTKKPFGEARFRK